MKSRLFVIYIVLLLSVSCIFAQPKNYPLVKIKRSEFKTKNKEGFKDAWFDIKDANLLYQAGVGTYSDARELYLRAHQYNSENAELNYLIGICYLFTDDKFEAIKYFRKAFEKKPKISPEIHYLLGRAYHLNLEFDKAMDEYNAYLTKLPSSEKSTRSANINKLIQECMNGKSLIEKRKRVIITGLSDSINSSFDDYFSIFSRDDSTMYFTSRRPANKHSKRNPYDNKYFEDVYTSKFMDGKWTQAKTLNKKINSSGNEAAVGISHDGQELFIYRGEDDGGGIYMSKLKNDKWKSPDAIPNRLSSDQAETSVFLTTTGDTMYYVSANEDLTLGGRDIFRTNKNDRGRWQKPQNLSSILNTPYDEEGIFLTENGREIYFSSKGHNTMGGYDIFKSSLQNDNTWSEPENLGYPINSPDDDLFYSVSPNGKYAYYSTNREGGLGGKDIFKVTFLGTEKEPYLEKAGLRIAGIQDSVKRGFFILPESVRVDSFFYLTGKVLDKKTNAPVLAKLQFIDVGESKIIATGMTGDSGVYYIKFNAKQTYGVEIVAKDYLFYLDAVNMSDASSDEPFIKDFYLEKIEVGTKVVLENIYFQTAKAVLTPASYPQLNQVIEFLSSNTSVKLEISGHTDNVGSAKVNTKLSEDRAKAVVNYMVKNGIDKTRLTAKGFGFSQPIAPNNTPEGREKNRRVEFKIISK